MAQSREITIIGRSVAARTASEPAWAEVVASNPAIPTTSEQIMSLLRVGYGIDVPLAGPIALPAGVQMEWVTDTCGTILLGLIEAALQNPHLTDDELDLIEQLLDISLPVFNRHLDTPYFYIEYTDSGSESVTEAFVEKIADRLDEAYQLYERALQVTPTLVPCPALPKDCKWRNKIHVRWYNIPAEPGYVTFGQTSPDGAIDLNSVALRTNEALAWATASHELFHRVQYAVGYTPDSSGRWVWFVEGTTAWSELFTTLRFNSQTGRQEAYVTSADRINSLFEGDCTQNSPLTTTHGYGCAAMWVFAQLDYQPKFQPDGDAKAIREFLANFKQLRDADKCYEQWWDWGRRLDFAATLALKDAWRKVGTTLPNKDLAGARYQRVFAAYPQQSPPIEPIPVLGPTSHADLRGGGSDDGSRSVARGGFVYLSYDVAEIQHSIMIEAWAGEPTVGPESKLRLAITALDANNRVRYYNTVGPTTERISRIVAVDSTWDTLMCVIVSDLTEAGVGVTVNWEVDNFVDE